MMRNYVIRVYRQNEEDPNQVLGVIEDIEENRQSRFANIEELIQILCRPKHTDQTFDEAEKSKANNNS